MNEHIEPSTAQANQLSNAVKDVSFVLANAIEAASAATTASAENLAPSVVDLSAGVRYCHPSLDSIF